MYTRKRDVRVVGISLLLFLIYSLQGWTQEKGLTITPTDQTQSITEGSDYTYENNLLTVKTSTPVTITSGGKETSDRIVIEDGTTATVTIDNVYINMGSEYELTVFDIKGNASVTLILVGVNRFFSLFENDCTICCESKDGKTASLTIEGTGTLIAENTAEAGGMDVLGALIGGRGMNSVGGNITIRSGVIELKTTRYSSGSGIGGGVEGSSGQITISGGVITVDIPYGTSIGAGINYSGNEGNITISGGVLNCNDKIGGVATTITGNPFIIATEIDKTNQSS